jgi:hypothetical protein
MSHFEPFPNQNQVICSDEQFLMSRGLPVRKWPSDLFKCNAAHAEIMIEDDPVWAPPPSISMHDHRSQAAYAQIASRASLRRHGFVDATMRNQSSFCSFWPGMARHDAWQVHTVARVPA